MSGFWKAFENASNAQVTYRRDRQTSLRRADEGRRFFKTLQRDVAVGRDILLANVAAADDLATLAANMEAQSTQLRRDVEAAVRDLQSSLRELELRMTIKLGAIVAASVALAAALQKLL